MKKHPNNWWWCWNFSKYQKWLEAEQEEEEGFNLTLINDPELTEQNFKTGNYDLVPIGFRMSM